MNHKLHFFLWIALCCCRHGVCYAQYENIWIFGRHAGLDFNVNPPKTITSAIDGFGEANASICDDIGNLLFYTEGSFVWDRNHNLMPNGSYLVAPALENPNMPNASATASAAQGTIIVPVIGNAQQYYIFSLYGVEIMIDGKPNRGRLHYSIVDMRLNGGLGDIVQSAKGILIDSFLTERMSAVVGDRCNIWLMVSKQDEIFRGYEITEAGINMSPVESSIGFDGTSGSYIVGSLVFSKNRKKMAATKQPGGHIAPYGCILADFDPVSGKLSNSVKLLPQTNAYGVAFSPNDSLLYVSVMSNVYQFDISSNNQADIQSSMFQLGRIAGLSPAQLKLAPDNKIYTVAGSAWYMGGIHNPNRPGRSADYAESFLELQPETTAHLGLPNTVPFYKKDTIVSVVTDSVPCFVGNSTLLPADTNGWDYIWSDGSNGKQLHVTGSGTYWVRYYGAPCTQRTDTFHVYIPSSGSLPQLHFSEAVCKGAKDGRAWLEILPGDTTTYYFKWYDASYAILSASDSLSALSPGDYNVQITTSGGCDTTLFFKIPETDYQVSFSSNTLVCQGSPISFTNTSDAHFNTFLWIFDDGNTSASHNALYTYTHSGTYNAQLIGIGAICTDTAHVWIAVDAPLSNLEFNADKESRCMGEQIQFYTSYAGHTHKGFEWQFGDGIMFTTADTAIAHAYNSDGEMFIKLTALFRACPDITYTKSVFVHPLPLVSLGTDSSLCLHGSSVSLRNHYPHQAGDQYLWNTGETHPSLNVIQEGNYSLTVTNLHGCIVTGSIEIRKDCHIDIPNAFSPNGDGINDYFFPRQLLSSSITSFRMQIFDRWGQKIFETVNTEGRGWNGRFNGIEQPQGVYVYIIEVELQNGRLERHEGNVTLIR